MPALTYGGINVPNNSLMKGFTNPYFSTSIADPLALAGAYDTSLIGAQQNANTARVPGSAGLEAQSSQDILGLLTPGTLIPDVARQSAEVAGGRGVTGSGAADSTAVRMTEADQLRRMALGEQFLSAADARNPAAPLINPLNVLQLQMDQINKLYGNQRSTGPTSSGVSGSGGPAAPVQAPTDPFGQLEQANPVMDTSGTGFPNYNYNSPGLDQTLMDLGLDPGLGDPRQGYDYNAPATPAGGGSADNYFA